jgi:hypothetical protein
VIGNELPHAGRSEDCRHSVTRNLKNVAKKFFDFCNQLVKIVCVRRDVSDATTTP